MPDLFSDIRKIPNERSWYLVSRDSKGKIRTCYISYEFLDDERIFVIHRITGQLHGKLTEQPDKIVERGKASRNLWEQVELEATHLVKEKLDKGYKEVEKDPESYSKEELDEILGSVVTSQNGIPKPMLAKQADKVTNTKIFDKEWYASRKIDGLRALIYMDNKGKLHTVSRGGKNYDAAMTEIINHKDLIKIFKKYPDLIMDGECYHHGWTLQQLNSVARTQVTAVDYEVLQFYWYDIVDTTKSFKERFKLMNEIKEELNLKFQPEANFEYEDLRIQFVPQILLSGWANILRAHNKYVEEGWEGLVIRDPEKPYKPNGRTNDMIKVKQYSDMEVTVIGYELGLRGSEDMVFKCILDNGIEFLAKPFGDRALKESYIENFDKLYKDKKATIKYFYLSDTGVPLQPALKGFRLEEDM